MRIRAELRNLITGQGYTRAFESDKELNAWLNYVQEPERALGCPHPLSDGSCGCRLIIKINEEKNGS